MADFDGASQAFVAWLSGMGAEIGDNIALQDLRTQGAGRGVVATHDIPEDTLLFRIPRSAILSVETSQLPRLLPALFADLDPWHALILVMMYEKHSRGASSQWAPYFALLPTSFNTLMFWEEDELAQLQASAVVSKIGKESADDSFRRTLLPVFMQQDTASVFWGDNAPRQLTPEQIVEEAHKLASTIMAYAFDLEPASPTAREVDEDGYASEDDDDALPKGMVPLADMLNADADRNNARLFYEENALCMKALKHVQAGEEILNDYGPLPRSDLLRRYGYTTPNYAQHDVVELPLNTAKHIILQQSVPEAQFDARLVYLDDQGVVDDGYDITASTPFDLLDSISPQLIILTEAMQLSQDDFRKLQARGKVPKAKLTARNAAAMREMMLARTRQYATTLDDDASEVVEVPVHASVKEQRYATAKQVRMGEKQILRQAEEALGQWIAQDSASSSKRRASDVMESERAKTARQA